jgi:hypothetical protein
VNVANQEVERRLAGFEEAMEIFVATRIQCSSVGYKQLAHIYLCKNLLRVEKFLHFL